MLPSTMKYLYAVEPVRMHFPAKQPCTNDTVCNAVFSWPAGHTGPTYKESFQVRWDNIIPLLLHAAIYLEVSLFRWTSQNAFSRETTVYKWYFMQCCVITCTRLFRGKMHSYWFNGVGILQGRWRHGDKVGYCYPSRFERLFVSGRCQA